MNLRIAITLVLLLSVSFYCPAQRSYYKKDRATVYDSKIVIEPGVQPYRTCKIKVEDGFVELSPEEISEYKSKYGSVFISYDMGDEGRAFIERTIEGPLSFYFLIDKQFQERYFVQKGSDPLVELQIPRNRRTKDYKEILTAFWTECDDDELKSLINTADLTKPDLERIVITHNECEEPYVPLPSIKVYVDAQFPAWAVSTRSNTRSSAISQGTLKLFDIDRSKGFTLGASVEKPTKGSNVLLTFGVKASYITMDFFQLINNQVDYTIDMKLIDIGLPIGLTYVYPKTGIRPFVNFEIVPSYIVMNDVLVRKIVLSNSDPPIISDFGPGRVGLAGRLGGGARIDLSESVEFIGELGYNHRLAMFGDNILNPTGPYILIGASFRSLPVDPAKRRRSTRKKTAPKPRKRKS
jgi:hypothetical protein